ncbi:hypothetical protein GIB67_026084 [Kingdonia uniflora]|uniref:Uncharacterized protein n=1 Tax=Kingdonia uniflora TaxID=39325 RepID=A0A7J7M372_9MAGN|nr:hypothetical protein GIB67_026084 [Kingdonia uniflora]
MLGKESLPPLELNKKRSRSVRILKRDSRSKLSTGGTAEKIVSAFHSVLSEHPDEDLIMSTCKSAVHHVRKMEKDVNVACTKLGDPKRTTLANELEEEETVLKETIEKLKLVETTRTALVAQLREALREQESELENVRTQLQVAQSQTEEARYMRKRLNNETDISVPNPSTPQVDPNSKAGETSKKSAAAIAAAVADRLTASTSSQQIMTSVLSSFAAEAVKNAGLATTSTPSNSVTSMPTNSFPESRPKQEKPVTVLDQNVYMTTPQPYQTVLMHQQIPNSQQPQYHLIRNPPPQQQYLHPPQGGIITYGYSTPTPPHPQPPPPQQMMNLTQPQYTTHPPTMIHQPPAPPSFRPLQPPGMMYYTYPHQPPQ